MDLNSLYFFCKMSTSRGERLKPKEERALCSSCASMLPERSCHRERRISESYERRAGETYSVEVAEGLLPVLDVLPKTLELVKANGARAVNVKDGHEHLDGV